MKRFNIKLKTFGFLFGALFILGSCTKLNETVYSSISAKSISEGDIQNMIAPVYSSLRNVYWSWDGLFASQLEGSDLYMVPYRIGIGWGSYYVNFHEHTWNSYDDHFYELWYFSYQGIDNINALLDMHNSLLKPYTAELRGFRALFYYVLFDNFRNVPLDTTAVKPGFLPKQATPQATYDFIVRELNDVKDSLSDDASSAEYGQFNKYAACMTLAKMYLNHNAWFGTNDPSYYQKALDEVNTVISSGKYQLATNYKDNFLQSDVNSPEVIFAIPFNYTYAAGNYLSNACLDGASAATFGLNSSPWDGSCAVPEFIHTYDTTDQRLKDTWLYGPQYDQNGKPIMINGKQMVYTVNVDSITGATEYQGARFVKYHIYSGVYGTYGDDVPFYRLADAYMIKAECLLRLGKDLQQAADLVSMVRQRDFPNDPSHATRTVAQLEGPSVYNYGSNGGQIKFGGLLDDLAWEFVGEHHRRQDLIRFKCTNGQNVWNGKSWFGKAAVSTSDTHLDIFPIYQSFIDADKNLVQNPGYN